MRAGGRRIRKRRSSRPARARGPAERFARRFANVEAACALVAVALAAAAGVLGLEVFTVQSGSMTPAIPANSLVIVETRIDPEAIATGEVVAYRMQGTSTSLTETSAVLHRVVENDATTRTLETKGDANEASDPGAVSYSSIIGKCIASIPAIGAPVQALSHRRWLVAAALALVNGVVIARALYEIKGRRRARRSPRRKRARRSVSTARF